MVFRQYLTPAYYEHFLFLNVAIKLLSSEPGCFEDNGYANNFLTQFVESSYFDLFYFDLFISFNIHFFMQLSADSYRFGHIHSYRAYRFLNQYGDMKRYLRKNDKPHSNAPKAGGHKLSERHFDGSIVQDFNGPQIKVSEYGG